MSKTALAMKPNARGVGRAKLAEAIEAREATAERLRLAQKALVEFEAKLETTRDAYFRADDALSMAREVHANALRRHGGDEASVIAEAIGEGNEPPRDRLRKAEEAYHRSKEAYTFGQEGRQRFKGAEIAASDGLDYHQRQVREAAERVGHAELQGLVERAERARAEHLAADAVLGLVARHYDGVQTNWNVSSDPLAARIRVALGAPSFGEAQAAEKAARAPWEAALAALTEDADAALPMV